MDASTLVSHSPTIALLASALAKAQGELTNPTKDSVNPHFKSKYADFAAVRDAVSPALSKNKLAVAQLPTEANIDGVAGPALVTMLIHESGEFIQTIILLRAQKNDPQGIGSALTYARRYALQSIVGVAAEEDDDGNAASDKPAAPQTTRPTGGQHSPPTTTGSAAYDRCNMALSAVKDVATKLDAGKLVAELKDQMSTDELTQCRTRYKVLNGKHPNPAPVSVATTDDDIAS